MKRLAWQAAVLFGGVALGGMLFLLLPGFTKLLVVLFAVAAASAWWQGRENQRSLREVTEMSATAREGVEHRRRVGNLWSKGWNLGGRSMDRDWADPRAKDAPAFGNRPVTRRPR